MTEHYDLYVQVSQTHNWASLRQYAVVAQYLKLTGLGIETPISDGTPKKRGLPVQDAGVCFFSRLTITTNKIPQIKHLLAKNRQQALIIAVEPKELSVCKWAAHDQRVDLITIDPTYLNIDKGLANLLKEYQKPVELIYTPLLRVSGPRRSKLFRNYYKILTWVLRKRIPLVISSGGTSIFDLRGKREIIAILSQLGLPQSTAQTAVSKTPARIIKKRWKESNHSF